MAIARKSFGDIVKSRQQKQFVHREDERESFERNLSWPVTDDRRQFIFNISGQGGVGKSELLKQFRQLAEQASAICVSSDDEQTDLPSLMSHLANQLKQQDIDLAGFDKVYAQYRQKRHELESDPEAPTGLTALLAKTAMRAGMAALKGTAVGNIALEFVDEKEVFAKAGEVSEFIVRKGFVA